MMIGEQQKLAAANEETLRRFLRARCPLLLERLTLPVDGSLRKGSLAASVLPETLEYLRKTRLEKSASMLSTAAFKPEHLRAIMAEMDGVAPPPPDAMAHLAMVEVTPRKLHVYWHLPPHLSHQARLQMGHGGQDAVLVLRFHDVTGIVTNPHQTWDGVRRNHVFDIEIRPEESKRYIELWSSDKAYIVDLGLLAKDGRFLTISRSNWVRVPRDSAGERREEWFSVDALRAPPLRPQAPECFPPQGVAFAPALAFDWPLRDLEAESIVKWAYERFRREGSRVFRRVSARKPDNATLMAAYERRQKERDRGPVPAIMEEKPRTAPEMDLFAARLDRPLRAAAVAPSKRAQPLAVRNGLARWSERLSSQTGAKLLWLTDQRWRNAFSKQSAALPGKAPEHRDLPAPSTAPRPILRLHKPKNFFQALAEVGVEMEAEIILRGRVKRGKKLRIGDRLIETNPDGTFCVACVLKDGKLSVPVEVVEGERIAVRGGIGVATGTP